MEKYIEPDNLEKLRINNYGKYLNYMKYKYNLDIDSKYSSTLRSSIIGFNPAYSPIYGFFINITYNKYSWEASDRIIARFCNMNREDFRNLLKHEYNAITNIINDIYFLSYEDCKEAIEKVIIPTYVCNKLLENT